jgi:hypothetical protein
MQAVPSPTILAISEDLGMSYPRRIIAVTFSCVVALFPVEAAYAQKHACTSLEGRHALDEADTLRSWDALYRSYLTFGHCDDGAIGEGYSESVARILADHWNTLPRFVQLAGKHAAFQAFVIRHLDATLNMDDVERIKQDAMTHCPNGLRPTCIRLIEQADSALKEASAP